MTDLGTGARVVWRLKSPLFAEGAAGGGSTMESQLAYAFPSPVEADRFLNHIKAGAVQAQARRIRGAHVILVSYESDPGAGFDRTCQQLDDLAACHDGREVAV